MRIYLVNLEKHLTTEDNELPKQIIEKFDDINVGDVERGEWTLLHYASSNGKTEIVKLLLAKGADIHARNVFGITPLHWASNGKVAELLIASGADVNIKSNDGNTPLHWTSSGKVAELLIANGADINAKSNDGITPLHWASSGKIADLLIANGADVNAKR